MHFIVETTTQVSHVPTSKECFIHIINNNDLKHPALSTPCLVYYRGGDKGFIFCIDHSESFSIDFEIVKQFILKHDKIYCVNAKHHKYFINTDKLIDVNFILLDEGKPIVNLEDRYTSAHRYLYRHSLKTINTNRLIPISKHYEMWENIYKEVKGLFGKEQNLQFYTNYVNVYQKIESKGISVEKTILDFFDIIPELSVRNGRIYSLYNLYNTTCRPTNSFNGVNFLALNKESGCRESLVPTDDNIFMEFDFDAYHLRLIANLIGYKFNTDSIHKELGKFYFGKDELTEEEYDESKKITFQNIYGGIKPEYMHIPFFNKMNEYIYSIWGDWICLPTGRKIKVDDNMNPLKAFNYCIQNLETKMNVEILSKLIDEINQNGSNIVLVVYDSFLVDTKLDKNPELIPLKVRDIVNIYGHSVKMKYGKDYHNMHKAIDSSLWGKT